MGKRIGHFDLIERLGKGPNGPTWLAVDTRRDQMVVIKLMTTLDGLVQMGHGERLPEFVERLSVVEHSAAIATRSASGANQRPPWVLRDFVSGLGLDALTHQAGALSRPLAVAILHEVAGALDAYHRSGTVYGNMKPSNLFITQTGEVRLLDPAIAQMLLAAHSRNANPIAGLMGAPAFLAPEQFAGQAPNGRTDRYQFGVLAHWLITHRYPFEAPDPAAIRRAVLEGRYEPVMSRHPDLQPQLAELIDRSLSSSPVARDITMAEARERCSTWLEANGTDVDSALFDGVQPFSYAFLMARTQSRPTTDAPSAGKPALAAPAAPSATPPKPTTPGPRLAAPSANAAAFAPTEAFGMEANEDPTSYELGDAPADDVSVAATSPRLAAAPAPPEPVRPPRASRPEPSPQPPAPSAPPILFAIDAEDIHEAPPETENSSNSGGLTISLQTLAIAVALVAVVALVVWQLQSGDSEEAAGGAGTSTGSSTPTDPAELLAAAKTAANGAPDAALRTAEAAAKALPNDPDAQLLLARALKRLGRTAEAAEAFSRAVRLRPADVQPQQELVGALLARGSSKQALQVATKALELHGTDTTLFVLRAQAEMAEENYLAASASLANATRLSPQRPDAWKLLGQVRSEQERWSAATDAWSKAVEFAPKDAEAYAGLAYALRRSKRPGRKITDLLVSSVRTLPPNQSLSLDVSRILIRDQRFVDAQLLLEPYTARYTDDWRGYFQLGLARLRKGEPAAATGGFEKALELQPDLARAWYNLGVARARNADHAGALRAFNRALEENPRLSDAVCERARTYQALGRMEEARTDYRNAGVDQRLVLADIMKVADPASLRGSMLRELPCGDPDLDMPE